MNALDLDSAWHARPRPTPGYIDPTVQPMSDREAQILAQIRRSGFTLTRHGEGLHVTDAHGRRVATAASLSVITSRDLAPQASDKAQPVRFIRRA